MKSKGIRPRRNEIYLANLPATSASVQYGKRPVFIVQNNTGNIYSPTTIVVPMTSRVKPPMPTHVVLTSENGLNQSSTLLCEQIMTVATELLVKKLGEITDRSILCEINDALKCSLSL